VTLIIKLNIKAFNELTRGMKDIEIANKMNVSTVQLWRVRLTDDDPRHNDPGEDFVAGALAAFSNKKFEDLFYLAKPLRSRKAISANNNAPTTMLAAGSE